MKQLNHLKKYNIDKIIKYNNSKFDVYDDGKIYKFKNGTCSCKSSQNTSNRKLIGSKMVNTDSKLCNHGKSVINSKEFGSCERCNSFEIEQYSVRNERGKKLYSIYKCSNCQIEYNV